MANTGVSPLQLVLLALAGFCFLLAGFQVAVHPRLNLVALGLALWVLSLIAMRF